MAIDTAWVGVIGGVAGGIVGALGTFTTQWFGWLRERDARADANRREDATRRLERRRSLYERWLEQATGGLAELRAFDQANLPLGPEFDVRSAKVEASIVRLRSAASVVGLEAPSLVLSAMNDAVGEIEQRKPVLDPLRKTVGVMKADLDRLEDLVTRERTPAPTS